MGGNVPQLVLTMQTSPVYPLRDIGVP